MQPSNESGASPGENRTQQSELARTTFVEDLRSRMEAAIPLEAIAGELVQRLRGTDYSIVDLLDDVNILRSQVGERAAAGLNDVFRQCVQRTAFVHERAIETMLHGFCEVDEHMRLLYANPALLKLVPDCVGRRLPDLFEAIGSGKDRDIWNGNARGLRRLQLQALGGEKTVLAEIGVLEAAPVTHYALFADMTDREEAERQANDRAEFGILRLDPTRRITYANKAACDLFEYELQDMLGRNAADLVAHPEDEQQMAAHLEQRQQGVSTEYDLTIKRFRSKSEILVKICSLAETNLDGELVGMFVTVSPLNVEQAVSEIQNAIAEEREPLQLFRRALAAIRPIVPFDYTSLSIFSEDRRYSMRLYVEPDDLKVEVRWFPIPQALRHSHVGTRPFGTDLASTIKLAENSESMLDHPAVKEFLGKGLRAWIAVPVQGGFDGVLSLHHGEADTYDETTVAKLARTGIATAMQSVLRLRDQREEEFRHHLIKDLAQLTSDVRLAELTVQRLADFYDWHNVSVFAVNRFKDRFVLLRQAAGKGGFLLPREYEQQIEKGYLGKALAEESVILVRDSNDPSASSDFQRASVHTRSELCVPIRVQGRVTWILNLEDRRPFAFTDVDKHRVESLMRQLEPPLERALNSALLGQILDDSPDGVIITDAAGRIVQCNMNAREMLDGEHAGEELVRFFVDETAAKEAASSTFNINVAVDGAVIGSEGTKTEVLIRARIARDESDRRIVILQDRGKAEWQSETRELIKILADLAAEARIPLSLASTFLRQIQRTASETSPRIEEIASRAIEQLGQVDLSYERVIDRAEASESHGAQVSVAIANTLTALSLDKSGSVDVDIAADLPSVRAGEAQLASAIKTMLGYLLHVGNPNGAISIRARPIGGGVYVTMHKSHSKSHAEGDQQRASGVAARLDDARARLLLDEPRLSRFAEHVGGVFRNRHSREADILRLVLPAGD